MIPDALKQRLQWVVWKAENNTKVPYDAKNGRMAKSNDPATWANYDDAMAVSPSYSGVGYVFSIDDPYTGIDLDDCIENEQVAPWAEEIVLSLKSYSEVSPSGKGIKIWVEGKVPSAVKTKQIEIYSSGRYFTMTGWHVDGTPTEINVANGALDKLWSSLQPKEEVPRLTTRPASRKHLERWAQHKIDYATERVAAALDGERHNERFKMARLLGGLVPLGLATEDEIERALFDANLPRTEAQRKERKTIRDGIRDGARTPLELPPEPAQPTFNSSGFAMCPTHARQLDPAKNGNGWKCRARDSSTDSGWCDFWWDGDGYIVPQALDPETGESLDAKSTDFLINANRSDTGNAECLAHLYGDDLRYCHTRKKWLGWDGSRWKVDEDGAAFRAIIATIRARFRACDAIPDHDARKKFAVWCIGCESAAKIEAALRQATRLDAFRTTIESYDTDNMLAATIGETIDLRSAMRRSVNREDFITMRLGTAYTPGADCPRWRRFLTEIFQDDEALIAFIQRAVGYCLTGDTREQKLFLLHGSGNNGKSVFLDVLSWLLEDYAGNASFETFDAGKRSESTNDLAALRGKRFVTVIETEDGRRLAEARVKSVTGQDQITCRFLYAELFTYRPTYKIWLAMNHLPVIRGTDRGIWRRILLVPFKQNFDGREDKTLRDTLRDELDGILNWAIEGLRTWHERGLEPPEAVMKATSAYRADSDQIGRWMTDTCVVLSNISCAAGTSYQSYKTWCESNGEQPMSQNKLGRALTDKGFDQIVTRNVRTWIGFGLRSDDDSPSGG